MENPRIRWLQAYPVVSEGKEMIVLSDDEGIVENSFVVSKDTLFLISLMDGTRSLRDIQTEYMRTYGQLIYLERLEEIVTAMDNNFLLLNENYRSRLARLKMEYEGSPVRKSALAGRSYPENRMDLLMQLDEMFKTAREVKPNGEIRAILAPHIDYARGIEVYRETYGYMKHVEKPLLVIFGTCHRPTEKILSISLKDFETPLDVVPTPRDLSALIRDNDLLRDYIDEWPHRNEHSIELQLPLIQFNTQDDFEILPILTGSMHEYIKGEKSIDDDLLSELVENLRTVLTRYGKPYIIIAGADLAHIGAQFGDPLPLDAMALAASKVKDEEILACIREANARAFFDAVKSESDARRICGLTPIYFQLRFVEGSTAEIVGYKQWTDGRSSVSFAGAVFHD
ncbi:AmmeMemoRadiSam system protein B [Syntrophorhabdus aromaticivorans]|nr:AmmeMemoRadiSam system protein B [Syntrophorhabdus aromaticivorans]